jgi:two-component system sensor histidine kinase BaeS
MSLRNKLILSFALVVVLMAGVNIGVSKYVIGTLFEQYAGESQQIRLNDWQRVLTVYYEQYGGWEGVAALFRSRHLEEYGYNGRWMDDRVVIADGQGRLIVDSDHPYDNPVKMDRDELHNGAPIDYKGTRVGTVWLINDLPRGLAAIEEQISTSIFTSIGIGVLITSIIAIGLGVLLSRRMTDPLESLTAASRQISAGDLGQRVHVKTADEIGELSRAFNQMADHLYRTEQSRRNLVADVAHELRTPLSVLQGQLESIQVGALEPDQEVIVSLHDEVLRMKRLVSDLQQLSSAEAGQLSLQRTDTDLVVLLKRILDTFEVIAEQDGVALRFLPEVPSAIAWIDADRITQSVVNLVGNALRHTDEGGVVTVRLSRDQNWVRIAVEDTGSGIAAHHLPYVFDRFYRTDGARNRKTGGSGLGLAIAKEFVEAHGGTISVASEEGRGSVFTIELPASA